MNSICVPYLRKFVLVFFDDILVYSSSLESHIDHLKQVLSVLRKHTLYAKSSKCSFGQSFVEYLGHVISDAGVTTDPSKIQCILDWLSPIHIKELSCILGHTGYYNKFIKNYAIECKRLYELLKKDSFKWSDTTEIAFQNLKRITTTDPVLALPDFTKPFIHETDACGTFVGAVLTQGNGPIAYLSKTLGVKNITLSTYEKEFLVVLTAVDK